MEQKNKYSLEVTFPEVLLLEMGLLELRQQALDGKMVPYFLKEDAQYLRYCAIEQLLEKLIRLKNDPS